MLLIIVAYLFFVFASLFIFFGILVQTYPSPIKPKKKLSAVITSLFLSLIPFAISYGLYLLMLSNKFSLIGHLFVLLINLIFAALLFLVFYHEARGIRIER